MDVMPVLHAAMWNAWLLMVPQLLIMPFFFRIAAGRAPESDSGSIAALSRSHRLLLYSSKLVYIPAFIYSIFLPLRLGTLWLDVGLAMALVGLLGGLLVLVSWARSPRGKPVTSGLYRYSRHPMYVTNLVFLLGVSIATASWVFLLFTVLVVAASFYYAPLEEASCLAQYGDIYREYMARTSKYFGLRQS